MSKNLFVKERSSERKKAVKVGQYQRITAQDCSILNGNAIHKKIDVKIMMGHHRGANAIEFGDF